MHCSLRYDLHLNYESRIQEIISDEETVKSLQETIDTWLNLL
jgi:hypothetical protein